MKYDAAMKSMTFFLFACMAVFCSGTACSQENTIELPISLQSGYGPFKYGVGGMSPYRNDENNPWIKTYLKVTGIPDDWNDAKQGDT
jgi:hypothetical protein